LRAGENTSVKAIFPGARFKEIDKLTLIEGTNLNNINFLLQKTKSLFIKVIDQITKNIVKDAYIVLSDMNGNNIPCYSNEKGEFVFYNLEIGKYVITVLNPNYEYYQKEISLSGEMKEILVELSSTKENW
jgi:hypothetical protein